MAMFAPELKFQKKEGTSKSPEAWSVTKSYCEIKYIYDTRFSFSSGLKHIYTEPLLSERTAEEQRRSKFKNCGNTGTVATKELPSKKARVQIKPLSELKIHLLVTSGPVHTYPDIFENGDFFSVFKKIRVHTQRFQIVFARPHEYAKAR